MSRVENVSSVEATDDAWINAETEGGFRLQLRRQR